MDAAVTVFGDLTGHTPFSPQAAALDLARSYAHDCLHYATFRRYRLTDRGEIARVQYGINFRQPDGRTYSAPDTPGDGPTRNLGIVMEGATDAEATDIARQAAQSCGITVAGPAAGLPGLTFADVTGTVTADDIGAALLLDHPYARSLGRSGRSVTLRYRALLGDLDASATDAHSQIITAMISGDLAPLQVWLDARHGVGSFARMFRRPGPLRRHHTSRHGGTQQDQPAGSRGPGPGDVPAATSATRRWLMMAVTVPALLVLATADMILGP